MKILELMGMDSTKYGGLEKFNIELLKFSKSKGDDLIFVYETIPQSQEFIDDIKKNHGVLVILNSRKNKLKYLVSLFKLIKHEKIEILHAHFYPARFLAIPLAYYFTNVKLFQTIHSSIKDLKLKTKYFYKYLLLNHSFTITVSNDIKEECKKIFGNKYKIETSYLGVTKNDYNRAEARQFLNLNSSDILILSVGNFNYIKGYDILVKAAHLLNYDGLLSSNIKFVIIGQPLKEKEELQKLIIQSELAKYFSLLGIRNDVPMLMKAADIYCQPSRSEGIPLSLMEALSAKLPIIASNVGGIPEVIKNTFNGILIKPESSVELFDGLKSLILSSKLREIMAKNSGEIFKNFDINNNVERLYSIYNYNNCYILE